MSLPIRSLNLLNVLDQSSTLGIVACGMTLIIIGGDFDLSVGAMYVLATWILLAKTTFGRQVYAVGGNAEAARLSGIRVDRVKVLTFTIGGFAAGVAGVIAASRSSSADPSLGVGLEPADNPGGPDHRRRRARLLVAQQTPSLSVA
jgi:ribose/xylose/arabinose/galactoside ABC-type transport system permease subunit